MSGKTLRNVAIFPSVRPTISMLHEKRFQAFLIYILNVVGVFPYRSDCCTSFTNFFLQCINVWLLGLVLCFIGLILLGDLTKPIVGGLCHD